MEEIRGTTRQLWWGHKFQHGIIKETMIYVGEEAPKDRNGFKTKTYWIRGFQVHWPFYIRLA